MPRVAAPHIVMNINFPYLHRKPALGPNPTNRGADLEPFTWMGRLFGI